MSRWAFIGVIAGMLILALIVAVNVHARPSTQIHRCGDRPPLTQES